MDLELFYDNMIRNNIPEEVLEEVNLSTLTPFRISLNRLRVDKNTIFLVIPDSNVNTYSDIHKSGFLLSNATGIITKNQILRLFNKQFNGLVHYKEMKKSFAEEKIKGSKRLLVLSDFKKKDLESNDDNTNNKNFYFYDLTLYVRALENLLKRVSERMATIRFFKELSLIYQDMKSKHLDSNIELLFLVKNKEGILYNIVNHLNELRGLKNFKDLHLFDNFGLVSNTRNVIFPILGRNKEKTQTIVFIPNLKKFEKYVDVEDISEKINDEDVTVDNIDKTINNKLLSSPTKSFIPIDKKLITPTTKKSSIFDKMVSNLKVNKLNSFIDNDTGKISIGLNEKNFINTLKKYKIDDPLITNNIKGALNSFIEQSKKDNKEVTNKDIYNVVLKTMNATIHQTDEVDEEYIKNPDKLIKKITNLNNHRVELNLPDVDNTVINPKDLVDIKYTTAAWRNKYEFDENVKLI